MFSFLASDLSPLYLILMGQGIFIFFLLCMLGYVRMTLFSAWHFSQRKANPSSATLSDVELPFVSIVVPARNEERTLATCLEHLKEQSYPQNRYEVLCIDDFSEDDTYKIAMGIAQNFPLLQVHSLGSGNKGGKKAALQAGISLSKGEIILQTDADCKVPPRWLEYMVKSFTPEVGMVGGPVKLSYDKSLLQRLQALEVIGLGILGGGAILGGKPHMCNGANLAFRRSVFDEVGGYEGIDHFASGDDELLLQKIQTGTSYQIGFCPSPHATVLTAAIPSWEGLKRQRLRWVSKVRYYLNPKIQLLQLISYFAFLGIGIYFFLGILNPLYRNYFFSLILVKFSADLILMYIAGVFFEEKRLLWFLPVLECLYVPYALWVGVAGNFVRSYTWKHRKVF